MFVLSSAWGGGVGAADWLKCALRSSANGRKSDSLSSSSPHGGAKTRETIKKKKTEQNKQQLVVNVGKEIKMDVKIEQKSCFFFG